MKTEAEIKNKQHNKGDRWTFDNLPSNFDN